MAEQPSATTSDENLLAAISHFFGLLVALVVWATQKDKSRFVRFQSTQAMAFDLVIAVITFVVIGVLAIIIFVILGLGVGNIAVIGGQDIPTAEPFRTIIVVMSTIPFLLVCIILPFTAIVFIARLVAAIETFQGKNFHYPWLGALVERSLR